MTTLFKPVKIESAEQAEALPVGTVGHEPPHLYAYIKKARNYWRGTGDDAALTDYEMLPFTALVPIEAAEEYKGFPMFPRPTDAPWPPRSTPNRDADGHWYYIDEDGYSTAHLGGHPFHDLMVAWIDSLPRTIRYVTPWESV